MKTLWSSATKATCVLQAEATINRNAGCKKWTTHFALNQYDEESLYLESRQKNAWLEMAYIRSEKDDGLGEQRLALARALSALVL